MTSLSTRSPHRLAAAGIELVLHVALLVALAAYCMFQCTAGTYLTLPWNTEYYDLASTGFRMGQLSLPIAPHPILLAQPNPFDPALRALWLWDALLWNGRYYIYWGPVPALCLLAYKLITGHAEKVYDQWLVLVFMIGRLLAGGALIWSVASRPNRRVPLWASLLGIAVFALASPTPFVMVRPVIYEASVAAGQCFLFSGLLAAFWAIRLRRLALGVVAGSCWALALHSRVTWLLVVPLLAACCTLAWYLRARREGRPQLQALLRAGCAFGLPVVVGIALAGLYNFARFGSPTDFGVAHQLTGRPFVSDSRFVLPNLFSYLFAEVDWSCRFPFAQVSVHRQLPEYITWPPDYDTGQWYLGERVSGLLITAPVCLLALVLFARPLAGLWKRSQGLRAPTRVHRLSSAEACLLVCALVCLVSLLPALGGFAASMRYLEDASGAALIVGCLGGFWLLRAQPWWARWFGHASFALLALYTIGVGVCLGFSGITDNFPRQNPLLYTQLANDLSLCPAPPPLPLPPAPAPPSLPPQQ